MVDRGGIHKAKGQAALMKQTLHHVRESSSNIFTHKENLKPAASDL